MNLNLEQLKAILRDFNNERDWNQFHSPDNLAKSVAIEAGELLECFQWDSTYNKHNVADEIADVMMYCIMLADKTDINLEIEIMRKLEENKSKYPVDKCKGKSDKYINYLD